MPSLLQHLAGITGHDLNHHRLLPLSGGDINRAYHLHGPGFEAFLKLNQIQFAEMFIAESEGLQALAGSGYVRVPAVLAVGSYQKQAYLLLEYLPLQPLQGRAAIELGQQLARLHRQPQAYFGWHRDNTIGLTPQCNGRYQDWPMFWQQQRLGKQLQWAAAKGYGGALQTLGEKLLQAVPQFFTAYQPQAALLHGDCWGGNVAQDAQSQPLLFDPACYFGDREADLAMTELFGGFGPDFYAAYRAEYPLDAGYTVRKRLYNLYHILNHLNLFGSGYQRQAQQLMAGLLAEL